MGILKWDKPKKARDYAEHNEANQSDSGIPGTYVPNMSDADNSAWKAKLVAQRVEIRKLFTEGGHYAQVLIVVTKENIKISTNGKIGMTWETYREMREAVSVAQDVVVMGVVPKIIGGHDL